MRETGRKINSAWSKVPSALNSQTASTEVVPIGLSKPLALKQEIQTVGHILTGRSEVSLFALREFADRTVVLRKP